MAPQNQYNSLPGDTLYLYQISVEKQHLMAYPGLISGIINLQLTRITHLLSRRENVFGALSERCDDSDGIREVPVLTLGYTLPQSRIL